MTLEPSHICLPGLAPYGEARLPGGGHRFALIHKSTCQVREVAAAFNLHGDAVGALGDFARYELKCRHCGPKGSELYLMMKIELMCSRAMPLQS